LQRTVFALIAAAFIVIGIPPAPAQAASTAKVVVVVGPVGSLNAHYKADANDIVAEAKRYTSNVVKLFTPNATWSKVRAAAQGASVFVYLGHGNGWPSKYAPFQTQTKNGLGLDPSTGADGSKTVYYGEDYIRSSIRFAPNAAVLLYHLCYASGNTEPGLPEGTYTQARERVDNYGAGFIGAGARAVFAEGHPSHPNVNYIRQLFTTNRSMETVFRVAPTAKGNVRGPFASQRTPGLKFLMDPDRSTPSGFYRSVIGDLSLTASKVTGSRPSDSGVHPDEFVVPGAAEVTSEGGAMLFGSASAAADPEATSSKVLARATRLRLTEEAEPAADGTRIFAATVLGTSTSGFVRATSLTPRDSAATAFWSFDASPAWLSPNDDNVSDELVLAPRFSETVDANYVVKNASGTTVRSGKATGDITRFAWDLRTSSGSRVPDGLYTWSLRGRDGWGNATAYRRDSFTIDGTPPVTKAVPASTAGANGWIVSPVKVTLTAKDALSGVRSISWRVNNGTVRTYDGVATISTNGTRTFTYRATDKAGIRESWKSLTFKIDTEPPAIKVALSGTKGEAAGTWRGPVTVTPTISDATSGVASKRVSIDGADSTALTASTVVVEGEGAHTVTFSSRDNAGNKKSTKVELVIDTVAPSIEIPGADGPAQTVTPNGDSATETVTIPYSVTERAVVTAVVTAVDGSVVRTLTATVDEGERSLTWDGRTAAGKPVRDGAYSVTLSGTDAAGNVGEPATTPVDVYAALAGLARTPVLFYPQDGDALAPRTKATWTLRAPAVVTVEVRNAAGEVVRTAYTAKELPAGAASWTWNGKLPDGSWAPRGRYRIVVAATNGTQGATQTTTVLADAWKLTPSVTTATRGKSFTITAQTAEPLSTTPYVTVVEPGLAKRKVTMTQVSASVWTAKITPRTSAEPGTMRLTVWATDTAGGSNGTKVSLALE
jgi:flagellar hook assembly protein FlgD